MNVILGFFTEQLRSFPTISSYVYGFASTNNPDHRRSFSKNKEFEYVKDETWRNAKESVVVKCHPLSSLMNTLGQAHIDYISLDVEGEEMKNPSTYLYEFGGKKVFILYFYFIFLKTSSSDIV
jgi:hypothetical protein